MKLDKYDVPYNSMLNKLNEINNKYLIKIGERWDFVYLEDNIKIESPVSSYYFKWSDLSINIVIKFKWSLYAYFLFNSILETIDDPNYINDISFEESIDPDIKSKNKKIFLVDDFKIDDFEDFKKVIENEYTKLYYSGNSVIRFKIKLNMKEFVILQNILHPRLVELI